MKSIAPLGALLLLAAGACEKTVEPPYPTEESTSSKPGVLVSQLAKLEIEGQEYDAEYGTLTVLEDRAEPDGRRIHLPVVRVKSTASEPGFPVFLLEGGPGQTNVPARPPAWVLENHDAVMVGYRGVDGSVSLECPEIGAAMVTDRPLSTASIERTGRAFKACHDRLIAAGVDVDRYTMLDVIDDLEVARRALGYERVHLYSESYGTRVAYLYALRYPESVHRSLMVGVNPPGHFDWEPKSVDGVIEAYGELWKENAGAYAPDLAGIVRRVLATLPKKWYVFTIDPDKVRCMAFMMLYHLETAVQVLEAFVAADEGDYAGLALLSFFFDQMIGSAVNWGDNVSKAMSADYEPERDYITDMNPPSSILGSPFSQLLGLMRYGGWPIQPIPEEYRRLAPSAVPTLMVNGNLDASTPAQYAERELLPQLENGEFVVLSNMGHVNDVLSIQPEAFQHMAKTFFLNGTVDSSRFVHQAVDFKPAETFGGTARTMLRWAIAIATGALIAVTVLVWLIVRWIRRSRRLPVAGN
jgi:pimeloyl-ACP methyl ester carboxylesterase